MKRLFLAASTLFSVLPGAAIIASGLGTPPGYRLLFGGVIEAIGVLTLLILWVNRKRISKFPKKTVTRTAIGLVILFIVFLGIYLTLFNMCVVAVAEREPVYYPLILTDEAADKINQHGGRIGAINYYGSGGVQSIIDRSSPVALSLTTILLLFIYQGIFTTLAGVFGLIGIHEKGGMIPREKSKPRRSVTADSAS